MKIAFVVAAYDCQQEYGGPEEGGWWYSTGELIRPLRVFKSKDSAYEFAGRVQDRLEFKRRKYRRIGTYNWISIRVYADVAPKYFPLQRPRYE